MRMLVFFDLPTGTEAERRAYRKFRKGLIQNGFMMMQESVYCRLIVTPGIGRSVTDALEKLRPDKGVVQILMVTEKQFANMQYMTGEMHTDVLDSDERLVIL